MVTEKHNESVKREKQQERDARNAAAEPVLPDDEPDLDLVDAILTSSSAIEIIGDDSRLNAADVNTSLHSGGEAASAGHELSVKQTLPDSAQSSHHSALSNVAQTSLRQATKTTGVQPAGKKGVKWEDEEVVAVEKMKSDVNDADSDDDVDSDDDAAVAAGDISCPIIRFRHSQHSLPQHTSVSLLRAVFIYKNE